MKYILIILLFLIILIFIVLMVLGYISRSGEPPGMSEGRLTECPDKPNCVCSEYKNDADHYIEPVIISVITKKAPEILRESIQGLEGKYKKKAEIILLLLFPHLFSVLLMTWNAGLIMIKMKYILDQHHG